MTDILRVATLNVWGVRGDWPRRRDMLRTGFRDVAADIVAVQESIVTDDYDQVRDVLGDGYHLVHSVRRQDDGQGISLASRWPLGEVHELDLAAVTDRTGGFACTALAVAIEVPDPVGPVLVVNHFPDFQLDHERERELQAVVVARFLAGRDERHVVVLGDLDAEPDAASIRFWQGRQSLEGMSVCFRDAWTSAHPGAEGPTYVAENPLMVDPHWPFRRIDHVLVGCDAHGPTLPVADCRRLFDCPVDGVWASDHFGLVADLAYDGATRAPQRF